MKKVNNIVPNSYSFNINLEKYITILREKNRFKLMYHMQISLFKLFFLISLFVIIDSNWILSIIQSNTTVNADNTLLISIKTSTTINSNSLKFILPQTFSIYNSTCTFNNITTPCQININTTTLEKQVLLTSSFTSNTQYVIGISIQNPYYSDNFQLRANNGPTSFLTTGLIPIDPIQVTCQLQGISDIVGDKTIGLITIQNQLIPLNSQISIKTIVQTLFKNIFNSVPNCSFKNISLPCSLTTIFNEQILQITSLPQIQSLTLNSLQINSINNSPYNNTFGTLELQIQDSSGYPMQHCIFQQSKPNNLQQIKTVVINGWNNGTGQQSNVSIYLNTIFTTLVNQTILIVTPSLWKFTPISPVIIQSSSTVSNFTRTILSNMTLTSSSILFYASIINPTFVIPLNVSLYVLFNQTNFRQQYEFSSDYWTLEPFSTTLINILQNNNTFTTTKENLTFASSYLVDKVQSGGIKIQLDLNFGKFVCNQMGILLNSNINPLSLNDCSDSQLIIQSDSSLLIKTYWLVYPVLNHFSTQSNSIFFIITSKIGNYLITSSSTNIILQQNYIPFQVINQNSKLEGATTIQIKQSQQYTQLNYTNYLGGKVRRNIYLKPPFNIIFTNTTTIQTSDPSLCQIISITSVSISSISLVIEGYLYISLLNINNPNNYVIGDRNWTLEVTDKFGNPSGNGNAIQTPQYEGIQSKFNFSLSNKTIDQFSNITINIQPQLYYTNTITTNHIPDIFITLSDSTINNVINCSLSCTLLSQKKLTLKLVSSLISQIIFQVKNSLFPTPLTQQISIEIRYGTFLYESQTKAYSLESMKLEGVSNFSGLYGQLGLLVINLTMFPNGNFTLLYIGDDLILQNSTCDTCSSTFIQLRGRVKYFQKSNITLLAKSIINGTQITYAKMIAQIKYTCYSIIGCRICVNQTSSTNITSLICQKCFDKPLNSFYLLYQKKCIDTCPALTYSDAVSCKKCPQNCYNCSDNITCLECLPDYFVYMSTCVIQCPAQYTKNSTHCLPKQIICPYNCINCPTDNVCLECEISYKLFKDFCYSVCPAGYITSKSNSTTCQLFIPPQEAKYFPFAFVICSILFLIVLAIIKCFQRRSLVMGNFISIISLLQFGSFLMTLVYTLIQVQLNLFLQALLFVIILSKILLNLTFLVYFMKNIRLQEEFTSWLDKYAENSYIYFISITLSSIVSFNIIRVIYSRFMGLQIFFGKFSSGLIFKPINYFSLTLTFIYTTPLVIMCLYDIELQQGYKTKIYYSAIQTVIMEAIVLISWIIDWKRGGTDQFFDFQVYKIQNDFQDSFVNPIGIGSLNEIGGSTQQILRSYRKIQQSAAKLAQWQRKRSIPFSQGALSIQPQATIENQPQQLPENYEPINLFKKRKSLFKFKILDQWRQISMNLPNANSKLRTLRKSHKYISKSPYSRISKPVKKVQMLKKSASLDKIEVKFLDTVNLTAGQKVRQYFYNISSNIENGDKNNSMISSVKSKKISPRQQIIIKNEQDKEKSIKNSFIKTNQKEQFNIEQKPRSYQIQKYQIIPITQMNEQKTFYVLDNSVKKQQIQEQNKTQNLEQILDNLTQINENKNILKQGMNKQKNILSHQSMIDNEKEELKQKLFEQDFIQGRDFEGLNKNENKLNFRKTTIGKINPLFNRSFDGTQHRYNKLIGSKSIQQYENQKEQNKSINKSINKSNNKSINKSNNNNKSINKSNNNNISINKSNNSRNNSSMNVQIPKVKLKQQINELLINKGMKQKQRRKDKFIVNKQDLNKLNENELNDKTKNDRQQEQQYEEQQISDQTNTKVNKNKNKKRRRVVKRSKVQVQIQKLYLQRLNNIQQVRSVSNRKRYKQLSNF